MSEKSRRHLLVITRADMVKARAKTSHARISFIAYKQKFVKFEMKLRVRP